LSIPDARASAGQFVWLAVGALPNLLLLTDSTQPPAPDGVAAAIEFSLAKYHLHARLLP